ncbi:MAG: B12-binding domain-containing radical SAM protein [Candidatus Hydrogenedentes bacterium]|nr:B12-binding domain-containing radical SAM protein [Candidatus Hydrogenedentota bacterium]
MRIALIAMSGIRVCDAKLLELGLTLPGFVERSKTIASLPSLGLLTLAGMTPKEHEVEYIEVPDIRGFDAIPNGFDLAAISSYSAQIDEAYELAEQYGKLGVPTVLGGPHVTCMPEEAAQHCDAVVIGEGELSWLDVLHDCENGNLKQFYGSVDTEFNLADSPVPSFGLLDIAKYNRFTIQTSRGCPHQCEFCASSILISRKYKQKPIGKVLAELDSVLELWSRPFIEFADDNSLVDHAYWKELLPELTKRRIRWFAETDISVSDDEKMLGMMRASGCAQVLIGLESPLQNDLDGIETRSNWKYGAWSRYKDAIKTIQSHGVTVNGCFILGLDGHGPDIFDTVFEFVKNSGLYEVQITYQTPFPGTPLYDRLRKEGRLLEARNWKRCTLFDVNYVPKHMDVDTLVNGFHDLTVRLYNEEFTAWRRNNFRRLWRESKHNRKEATQ